MEYVSLNGVVLPRAEAVVSIEDRGFRFGDGVFETIHIRDGAPYLWPQHLERLKEGLEACGIGYECGDLRRAAEELLARNAFREGLLRITVTRGVGSRGYLPFPHLSGHQPTVVLETLPYTLPSLDDMERQAVTLCLSSHEKISPNALPTRYKLMQGMNSILARMEAERQGHFDALLLSHEGVVSECSAANIFWCIKKTLYTPALESGCLAGVMRERIMELSEYRVCSDRYRLRHLLKAEAVFLSNSAYLVMPVHRLAGYTTHWNASGKLAKIYRMLIEKDIAAGNYLATDTASS
jgi:branched-chain amino acid aminotransferase